MAIVAVIMCVNFAACSDDDSKSYPRWSDSYEEYNKQGYIPLFRNGDITQNFYENTDGWSFTPLESHLAFWQDQSTSRANLVRDYCPISLSSDDMGYWWYFENSGTSAYACKSSVGEHTLLYRGHLAVLNSSNDYTFSFKYGTDILVKYNPENNELVVSMADYPNEQITLKKQR